MCGFDLEAAFPEILKCRNNDELDKLRRKFHALQMLLDVYEFPVGFASEYAIDGVLGDGTFGFVMCGRRLSDGKKIAVKFISKRTIQRDKSHHSGNQEMYEENSHKGSFFREAEIISKCKHKNIIAFIGYFQDTNYYYLITERHGIQWRKKTLNAQAQTSLLDPKSFINLVPEDQSLNRLFQFTQRLVHSVSIEATSTFPTDLFECIESSERLQIPAIKKIINQLIDAMIYLEEVVGCSHGDVKDENILIDAEYNIKLIDFGSAFFAGDGGENGLGTRFFGTLQFAPPEVLKGQGYFGSVSDVWSVGLLLFLMLTGFNYVDGIV